jgi:hypothetical protein
VAVAMEHQDHKAQQGMTVLTVKTVLMLFGTF